MKERPVSQSIDDYLKAILEISEREGRATTSALARRLDVTAASVTGMLRKLAEVPPGLVSYEKHHGAVLTPAGRLRALEILRHHRLLETFLHDTLGYSWDEVHTEAERLEHAISETLEDRIAEALGHPEVDPHGHPIPRKDGSMPDRAAVRLAGLAPGMHAEIARVSDGDPELLRYVGRLGLTLGQRVEVISRSPFDGPILVKREGDEEPIAISARVAEEIHVVADHGTASV